MPQVLVSARWQELMRRGPDHTYVIDQKHHGLGLTFITSWQRKDMHAIALFTQSVNQPIDFSLRLARAL